MKDLEHNPKVYRRRRYKNLLSCPHCRPNRGENQRYSEMQLLKKSWKYKKKRNIIYENTKKKTTCFAPRFH